MKAFLSTLTAALLFIHTVFGCCWHHAHGCEHSSTIAVSQPAKCCHHHQHDSNSKQHHAPDKCQVECGVTCNYVVPQKVKIQAPEWFTTDLIALPPSHVIHLIEAAAACEALSPLPDWAPPLRTHLLHQVLLN